MFEVGRPFYDGLKPFGEREDVDSARRGLASAMARARERIDELLGPRQWTWIDSPAEEAGPCHVGDDRGGIEFSRQGMTMGVPRGVFGELVDVVREEVGPLGFTEIVDISTEETGEVNLFNVDDGGYVGIVLSGGPRAFSMRYTTGCRPFPEDAPAAQAGRSEAEDSGARGSVEAGDGDADAFSASQFRGEGRGFVKSEPLGMSSGESAKSGRHGENAAKSGRHSENAGKPGRHSEAAAELGSTGRRRHGRHRDDAPQHGSPASPSNAPDTTKKEREAGDGWTSRWPMVDD